MDDLNQQVKVRLIYPHQVGDIVPIFGAVFERDGDHHYAIVDQALADSIVAQGGGEIINA